MCRFYVDNRDIVVKKSGGELIYIYLCCDQFDIIRGAIAVLLISLLAVNVLREYQQSHYFDLWHVREFLLCLGLFSVSVAQLVIITEKFLQIEYPPYLLARITSLSLLLNASYLNYTSNQPQVEDVATLRIA